jgi:hypothetical protein
MISYLASFRLPLPLMETAIMLAQLVTAGFIVTFLPLIALLLWRRK